MAPFRPTRASPPSRFSALSESVSDTSHAALLSAHELKDLSPQDVELIEAVMRRAGANATSFQSVLSSYNEILKERGINAHEAVYFAKLLKIGTLKGRNWGDKWNIVKETYGYVSSLAPALSKVYSTGIPMAKIPSHERTESPSEAGLDSEYAVPQYQRASLHFPHRVQSPSTSEVTPASSSNDAHSRHLLLASTRVVRHDRLNNNPVLKSDSLLEFDTPPLGLSPYRRPKRAGPIKLTTSTTSSKSPTLLPSSTAHRVVAQARERKGSIVNETDVWKNIELQRHEEDADKFREDKLQERYWEIWKLGFEWIRTTSSQIVEARDSLLIRETLQRWRDRFALRNELYRRVEAVVIAQRMRSALNVWRRKLNEKREAQWRQIMRVKMKAVKDKRERKLIEGAWAKWRQNDSSRSAQRHYSKQLLHGMLRRWKDRLNEVDNLQHTADDVSRAADILLMKRSWKHWRRGATLQATERVLVERIDLRMMSNSLDLWRERTQALHTADEYRNFAHLRYFLALWRNKLEGIRVKEERAKKHLFRQDHLLIHAVMRVWRARERGIYLESGKTTKILKNAVSVWKKRLASHKAKEDLALAFRSRSDSHLVVTAMHSWRQVFGTHQNALSFAVQYHAAQAKYRMLLAWRIGLRKKVKMIKMGRLAERYFATRAAWRIWNDKLDEKRRENQLKGFQRRKLRCILQEWLRRTHKVIHLRSAEIAIGELVKERILRHRLTQWTNRVIEIKVRELELVQQHNSRLQLTAFRQWKRIYDLRAESLSLLENYLIVKREEMAGRMFHRWLTVARVTRHRRLTLQLIEDQLRIKTLCNAWDKWRGSFIDVKLHPIEMDVLIQMQKNLLFRAFGLWRSKTKSLPAIRFHGIHLKTKYFEVWRLAMPRALQGKEARHHDKMSILKKTLTKWTQAYRTKIALKAVARARYLRLPAAIPRQVVGQFSAFAGSANPVSQIQLYHRSSLRNTDDNEETVAGSSRLPGTKTSPFSQGTGVISLLRTSVQSRTSVSPPRSRLGLPRTRQPSPTRSTISVGERPLSAGAPVKGPGSVVSEGGGGRKFWLELQEVRRKAKPPFKPSS